MKQRQVNAAAKESRQGWTSSTCSRLDGADGSRQEWKGWSKEVWEPNLMNKTPKLVTSQYLWFLDKPFLPVSVSSLTHLWGFPPLPLPSCWEDCMVWGWRTQHGNFDPLRPNGRGVKREGAVGQWASPEVNAKAGGAAWPHLRTHLRNCSTYLQVPGISVGSPSPTKPLWDFFFLTFQ